MRKNLGENYNPLYFLSALGSGGLGISFFMYLMFMVKHPGRPMANFEHVYPVLTGDFSFLQITVAIALIGILFFSIKHFQLLFWNISEFKLYKQTAAYAKLKKSNAEVTLMAIPLTLGMTVNAVFILAGVFIPNLWDIVEYLFPFSLLAYGAVGVYALVIFKGYFTRFLIHGDFDYASNSNLSQMLGVFAFSMVAVGFAAPAAMSHTLIVSAIGTVLAVFFGSVAVLLLIVTMVLGFKSMLKQGIDKAGSPSIWMIIPILTLLGITVVRLYSGINHNILHVAEPAAIHLFIPLTVFVSIQVLFGFLGYSVLKKLNYFQDMIHGSEKSPGSFSLICPGVAFFVLGMFFVHWGFVKTGIITQFSATYFAVLLPFIIVQMISVKTILKLNKKLLSASGNPSVSTKAM
ncbi:TsoY family (seleno)protein [Bacillus marasmi]|uniref:TsoY family (seleno)protein n=1 Tax=Bacillus marasmi TaxID=1926279 RepID=UPI001C9C4754|nr:hypothetical protein [Bacillus marasmi]